MNRTVLPVIALLMSAIPSAPANGQTQATPASPAATGKPKAPASRVVTPLSPDAKATGRQVQPTPPATSGTDWEVRRGSVRSASWAGIAAQAPERPHQLKANVRLAGIEMESAAVAEKAAKARFEAGLCPMAEWDEARARRERAEIALMAAQQVLAEAQRIEALAMPVDMDLKDATVQQVASVLSTATGVSVDVSPQLATSTQRITAKARSVPIATLLENIAAAVPLSIAPSDSGGIILRPAPSLQVGGKTVPQPEAHAPWSAEWDRYPEPALPLGAIRGWRGALPTARPAMPSAPPAPQLVDLGPQVSVAAAGEGQFVLAERGVAPDGRPCVLLSLYRVVNGQMKRIDTAVHRLTQAAPKPASAPKRK